MDGAFVLTCSSPTLDGGYSHDCINCGRLQAESPNDLASVIAFLATDEARCITGQLHNEKEVS
jgi:hypothetical protein